MPVHKKKRQFEMGRMPTNTKLGAKKITLVRGRGGNFKHRALRIDAGTFSWGSEAISRKTRVLDVVYNATNNELVRTKTLVKNAIVRIDATPFRQWYLKHYDVELNKKKVEEAEKARAD
jgi:small subunit ribosomal protein S8e